jgi:hypothetical protein
MACATRSIRARRIERPGVPDLPELSLSTTGDERTVFSWKDFSRFVHVAPVERGWLVLWGHFRDGGRTRNLAGQRTYLDLAGVRRRVADSVFELTRSPELVAEAMIRFDRTPFPVHLPTPLPAPL